MIYLLLSILSTTVISFIFTWFEARNIEVFQAIVINYFVCVLTAAVVTMDVPIDVDFFRQAYFPYALGLGMTFIIGFNIVGQTVQKFGIAVGTIMQKMSLLISVPFAIIYFSESFHIVKAFGLLLAIIAIYFTNKSNQNKSDLSSYPPYYIMFPIITLFVAAGIEIFLQLLELRVLETSADPKFVALLFGLAGCFGLVYSLFRPDIKYKARHFLGGLVLGVPNFFSIYFMMKALGAGIEGSIFFPINNMSSIALAALGAFLLFKQKLSKVNLIGVLLAIISICLLSFW